MIEQTLKSGDVMLQLKKEFHASKKPIFVVIFIFFRHRENICI